VVYDESMSDVLDLRNLPEEEVPGVEPAPEEVALLSSAPDELSWDAHAPLSPRAWRRHYIALGTAGIVGTGVAVWQSSWLVFATLAVCLGTWELVERFSRPMSVSITSRGISMDGHHYPHTGLTSFDIHRLPDGSHQLSVHTDSWRMPRLRIPLSAVDPHLVHRVLSQHLPEGDHPLPFYERWLRKD